MLRFSCFFLFCFFLLFVFNCLLFLFFVSKRGSITHLLLCHNNNNKKKIKKIKIKNKKYFFFVPKEENLSFHILKKVRDADTYFLFSCFPWFFFVFLVVPLCFLFSFFLSLGFLFFLSVSFVLFCLKIVIFFFFFFFFFLSFFFLLVPCISFFLFSLDFFFVSWFFVVFLSALIAFLALKKKKNIKTKQNKTKQSIFFMLANPTQFVFIEKKKLIKEMAAQRSFEKIILFDKQSHKYLQEREEGEGEGKESYGREEGEEGGRREGGVERERGERREGLHAKRGAVLLLLKGKFSWWATFWVLESSSTHSSSKFSLFLVK